MEVHEAKVSHPSKNAIEKSGKLGETRSFLPALL